MAEDRKTKRTIRIRSEIMDAAIDIISEKGFNNSTTKEIAKTAGIAEGTIYNYFDNKSDILLSIAERYMSYKRSFDYSSDISSTEEFIKNMFWNNNFSNIQKDHAKDRKVLKAMLPEFLSDRKLGKLYFERIVEPFLESTETKLSELKDRGIIKDYDVRALSRMLYSSIIGYAILEINGDPMVTDASASFREEASRAYVGVFGKGMGK
jgi:AcrR family transcriptional regulator